jgi:hypothetical protein
MKIKKTFKNLNFDREIKEKLLQSPKWPVFFWTGWGDGDLKFMALGYSISFAIIINL